MKKRSVLIISAVIVIVCIIFAVRYGFKEFNRTAVNLENKEADISVTVPSVLAEFQADENAANTKYLDKVIQVKGKIAEVKKDDHGAVKLSFESDDPMATVIFEMDPSVAEKVLALQPQSEVVVKGICTGSTGDVICTRGVIK